MTGRRPCGSSMTSRAVYRRMAPSRTRLPAATLTRQMTAAGTREIEAALRPPDSS